MKKFLLYLFLITALILPAGVALAAWGADIVVTENGTASHEMLGCNITANIDYIEVEGYIGANGTDTLVEKAGVPKPHMLVDDRIMLAIPVSGNSTNNLDFTTENTPVLDSFYIIPGYDGYITVADNTTIELGDNFTVTQSGWVNTDNGSVKNLVFKDKAFLTAVSGTTAEEIFSSIIGVDKDNLDFVPGNSAWVQVADDDDFSFTAGGGVDEPFSLVAWVNLDDATSRTILAKWNTNVNQSEWNLVTDAGDLLQFYLGNPDATATLGRKTGAITAYQGSWAHIVATYDGSETLEGFDIYIDGVVSDTGDIVGGAYAGMTNGTEDVNIGSRRAGTQAFMDGGLAEIKIYDIALTQAQVLSDFYGEPLSTNLMGLWRFDEGAGNPQDTSGKGHHGVNNGADWDTDFDNRYGATITATGVSSGEETIETIADSTFFYIEHGDITWDNNAPQKANLELNIPLWHQELSTSPFTSKDVNEHSCVVTEAVWSNEGRLFDGANDKIVIGVPAGINIATGTCQIWLRPDDVDDGTQLILDKDQAGNNAGDWALIHNNVGGEDILFRTNDGVGNTEIVSDGAVTEGSWVFVTVMWGVGGMEMYIGITKQVDVSAKTEGMTNVVPDLVMGHATVSFEGMIGKALLYDVKLTPTEIEENYDATKWKYDGSDEYFYYNLVGPGVPNNANDWALIQNNVMPYADNITISVNGTLQLWFEPEDIIAGTTLPDRATSVANDGTFTFGSNPSGIGIALGAFASDYSATEAPPLATPDVVPVLTPPVSTADAAKLAGLASHPLTPAIHAIATVSGIYELLFWWFGTLVLGLLLFGVTYKWIKNLMISGAAFCAVVAYGVTIGIFDFWVVFVIIVILLGCVVLQSRRATG